MSVTPTSERLFPINPMPITKKGIQEQNPQLGRIFTTGKEGRIPQFVASEEKTSGAALGAIYLKQHRDSADPRPCKRWVGKVGQNENLLPHDNRSGELQRRRTRREINISAICEKLASDLYGEMGRGIFNVPKTCLSMQPITNAFTQEHDLALSLLEMNISNSLQIMSRYMDEYSDFEKAQTLSDEGELLDFMVYIARYHRPPEKIIGPNAELVPLLGFMGLLAIGRILADIDVIGNGGNNAGFVYENGHARTVKIDPGFAFKFKPTCTSDESNWIINTNRKIGYQLEDIRNLQTADNNRNAIVKWEALTPSQKDEFLAALFNCGRYLNSKEVLHFLFYRDGNFTRSDIEQIPEKVANDKVNEMVTWMDSQANIYRKDLTDFRNRHPEQVLKAHYVDNCGELFLPMSNKTFPAGDLFTQLVIVAGDEQETRELETLELPERDSLRETQKHMQQVNNPLPIESLFDSTETQPSPKKVLLIGRAGVGKSTLCQKIAHDWASGKEWKKFHAIYWISLRDVNDKDYLFGQKPPDRFLASIVAELLLKDPGAIDGVLEQIQKQKSEILVIFDGYDEASEELRKTIDPLLADPELHILLTSRPGVTARLHSNMDRLVENMGFSDKEVESYVGQFFNRLEETAESKQRAQKFLKAIKGDSNLSIISHIPLQLQMLCCLWEQEAEENGFANNIISLYHEMVDQLFCWQCKKQGRSPLDVRPEEKEKLFSLLGHIAYLGLASGKLLFPKAKIENTLQGENISEKQLLDTGLLKVVGEGEGRYYYFLHLTFQEYLIAFAISRSTTNQRNRFILENRYKPQYQLVMIFLAGLVHQRDGSFAKREVRGFFEKLHEGAEEVAIEQRLELTLNCLKECPDYSGPVSSEFESLIKGDPSILDKKLSDKHTPFLFAAGEGNVPGMRWLHCLDPTLCNKTDERDRTPFHEAARDGHIEAMKLLHSWDPTLYNKKPTRLRGSYSRCNFETPFHTAVSGGHTEAMKLFHSWDPTLYSKPDRNGETPFHWAADGGHTGAMDLLHSWDPTLFSKPNNDGRTPFHWVANGGHTGAMDLLHSWDPTQFSKPDNDGRTPFHLAASHGHTHVMKLLNKWDPTLYSKPDKYGETPFHVLAGHSWGLPRRLEALKLLFSWDPTLCSKPDNDGETPFHKAASGCHIKTMELLHTMDPSLLDKADKRGRTPFHHLTTGYLRDDVTDAMEWFFAKDPNLCSKPDSDGKTPFHDAAKRGNTNAMEWLFAMNPSLLEKVDKRGRTPFHDAAKGGDTKTMELLLTMIPSLLDKVDKRGRTPFYWAAGNCRFKATDAMEWLFAKDPSLFNKPDNDGETPFHKAAGCSNTKTMEWFLEKEPLFLKKMDKRSKRLLKEHASDSVKKWILKKEPTFFDEGCVIS